MSDKTCNYCKKDFSYKQNCVRHEKTCRFKSVKQELMSNNDINSLSKQLEETKIKLEEKKKEVEQKDEQIAFLKTLLESCIQKPTIQKTNQNTQNITINNNITTKDIVEVLEPIEFEEIKESLKEFGFKYIRKGIKGLAEYLCKTSCNGKIVVTDNSRDILAYNTKQKKYIRDPKGQYLLNKTLRDNSEILLEKVKKDRKWMYETQEENEYENEIKQIEILQSLIKKSNSDSTVEHTDFSAEMKKHGIENLNKKFILQEEHS